MGFGEWFVKFNSRKMPNFGRAYDKEVGPLCKRATKVMEIGVRHGGSIRTWHQMFPKAKILGVDRDPYCNQFINIGDRVNIVMADQRKKEDIEKVGKIGPWDMIVEDGSHMMEDQINCFKWLFPYVKPGGVYIVEDLHTSYIQRFNGNRTNSGNTALNYFTSLVNNLNYSYLKDSILIPIDSVYIAEHLESMNLYASIGFLWKKK